MDNNKLIIVGGGVLATTVYKYFTLDSDYNVVAFAVHSQYKNDDEFLGLPLYELEKIKKIFPPSKATLFVAISDHNLNRNRAETYQALKDEGYSFANYIHSSSKPLFWSDVKIGSNCLVAENVIAMDSVEIGNNVVLGPANLLGHRSTLQDNCFLSGSTALGGGVVIGENSYLGLSCAVADDIVVARDNYIAMGTVISKNTKEDTIYRGNPAKPEKISAKEFCRIKAEMKLQHKVSHVFF